MVRLRGGAERMSELDRIIQFGGGYERYSELLQSYKAAVAGAALNGGDDGLLRYGSHEDC